MKKPMDPLKVVGLFLMLALCSQAHAEPAPLRWGGDSEGGAPYVFQDPQNPKKIIGFEVDLVDELARRLGRSSVFVQNQWDGLIPGLDRGTYDVAVNGLEITEDRKRVVSFSDPYFVTYEQLTVRKDTDGIAALSDLNSKTVGTLKGSVAERMLVANPATTVRSYDGQINAYQDLQNGRLDAVLMDHPIALYYAVPIPNLRDVGDAIGRLEYGVAVRKNDPALLAQINGSLAEMAKDGSLRRIYDRWGMSQPMNSRYFGWSGPALESPSQYHAYLESVGVKYGWKERLSQYVSYLPLLGMGALSTLQLSLVSMILAVALGLLITLVRLYAPAPFSQCAVAYVELVRGTPLIIQLFLIFYGLPNLGIKLSPFVAAVLGLGLNYAAYESENYRAGILAIPRNQMDSALSLGMSRWQALKHIVIPQATRVVIPPVTNDFISLLKDSSLVSIITMVELTKVYGQLASTYYDYFGIGILAAIIYFLIGLPFVRLSRWLERSYAFDRAS